MTENEIAAIVVDAAFKIHTQCGPGLLESAYQAILVYELKKRGLQVATEQPIPIYYDQVYLDVGFRADLIVENSVIVELKSVEQIAPVHKKQLLITQISELSLRAERSNLPSYLRDCFVADYAPRNPGTCVPARASVANPQAFWLITSSQFLVFPRILPR